MMKAMVMLMAGATLVFVGGCNGGGGSTPEEDAEAIGVYTQTVNQSSADSSEDTTVSVNPTVTGNNNTIIVVVSGDNSPVGPEAEAVAEEP